MAILYAQMDRRVDASRAAILDVKYFVEVSLTTTLILILHYFTPFYVAAFQRKGGREGVGGFATM